MQNTAKSNSNSKKNRPGGASAAATTGPKKVNSTQGKGNVCEETPILAIANDTNKMRIEPKALKTSSKEKRSSLEPPNKKPINDKSLSKSKETVKIEKTENNNKSFSYRNAMQKGAGASAGKPKPGPGQKSANHPGQGQAVKKQPATAPAPTKTWAMQAQSKKEPAKKQPTPAPTKTPAPEPEPKPTNTIRARAPAQNRTRNGLSFTNQPDNNNNTVKLSGPTVSMSMGNLQAVGNRSPRSGRGSPGQAGGQAGGNDGNTTGAHSGTGLTTSASLGGSEKQNLFTLNTTQKNTALKFPRASNPMMSIKDRVSSEPRDVRISKALAAILRHGKMDINLDDFGYAMVDDILGSPFFQNLNVSMEDLERVTHDPIDKVARFAMVKVSKDKFKMRATDGHSILVRSFDLVPMTIEDTIGWWGRENSEKFFQKFFSFRKFFSVRALPDPSPHANALCYSWNLLESLGNHPQQRPQKNERQSQPLLPTRPNRQLLQPARTSRQIQKQLRSPSLHRPSQSHHERNPLLQIS